MDFDKIMYAVGEIVRCTYGDDAPENVMKIITSHPLRGIGLMASAMKQADQEEIGRLMKKIPGDFEDPKKGVPIGNQGPFWIGYYHYAALTADIKNYGPTELAMIGEMLFGGQWQTDLAKAINISDARRIRAWMAGERKIPAAVWHDIAALLRSKQTTIGAALKSMTA